jgi:hypothetical protein
MAPYILNLGSGWVMSDNLHAAVALPTGKKSPINLI